MKIHPNEAIIMIRARRAMAQLVITIIETADMTTTVRLLRTAEGLRPTEAPIMTTAITLGFAVDEKPPCYTTTENTKSPNHPLKDIEGTCELHNTHAL
jgi:hypothetical protein